MAGFFDNLWGNRDPNDPVNYGLLQASAALGTPVRQGGGVGAAFGAFGQGVQGAQSLDMRRRLMESQIAENARTQRYKTVGKNLFDMHAGKFVELPAGMTADDLPSDVQSFNEFMRRSPAEQQKWLDFRRQNYKITDVGGMPSNVRAGPDLGTGTPPVQSLSPLEIELEAARRKKAVEASGSETGKVAGVAESELAGSDVDLTLVEKTVKTLKEHPGKRWAVGVPLVSQLPEQFTLAGTQHADFLAQYKKAVGGVFLEGYKILKGGGQITEIEGNKAQAAKAAMDRAQSKEAFDAAMDDYQDAFREGIKKLKAKKALGTSSALPSRAEIEARMTPEAIRKAGEDALNDLPPVRAPASFNQWDAEKKARYEKWKAGK